MDKILNKDVSKILKSRKRTYYVSPLLGSFFIYFLVNIGIGFKELYINYDLVRFSVLFFPNAMGVALLIGVLRFLLDSSRYRLYKLSRRRKVYKLTGYVINKQALGINITGIPIEEASLERILQRRPNVSELRLHSIVDKDLRFTTSFLTKFVLYKDLKKILKFSEGVYIPGAMRIEVSYIKVYNEIRVVSVDTISSK